jgi:peptidoglycan hydrolase-like amidase
VFHLVASTLNQQYNGRVPTDSPVWAAVNETVGQVLLWNGDLFRLYHTDSGGTPRTRAWSSRRGTCPR